MHLSYYIILYWLCNQNDYIWCKYFLHESVHVD